jgi:Flp pilus assembly protein TadD
LNPVFAPAATDPADIFLNAYFVIQDGDDAAKASQHEKACEKFKQALEILKDLQKSNPGWNPHIVDYRLKYCSNKIAEICPKVPPPPAPAASPKPAETTTAAPATEAAPAGTSTNVEVVTAAIQALPTGSDLEKIHKLEEELKASRAENLKLRDQVSSIESELAKVKTESVEKINALNEQNKALEEKLAAAQAQLTEVTKRAEAAETKVAEVEKLQQQFAELQTSTDRLDKRNKELEAGSKEMQAELNKLRDQLKAAAEPLDKQLKDLQAQNKEMAVRLAKSEGISSSMKEVVVSGKARLRTAEAKLDELGRENERLSKENKSVQKLRDEIASLKRQLSASESQYDDKLKTLQQQNDSLTRKLADSEKTVASLQKATVGSGEALKEIQALRQQLNTARTDLETAQARNADLEKHSKEYQAQIEKLKTQTASRPAPSSAAASSSKSASMDDYNKLQKENARLSALVAEGEKRQAEQKSWQEKTARAMAELQQKYQSLQSQLNVRESTEKPPKAEEQAMLKQPAPTTATPSAEPKAEPTTPKQVASTAATPPPAPSGTASATLTSQKADANLSPELAALLKEGQGLFEERKFAEAEAKFLEVAEKSPNNPSALSNLAVAQYQQGKLNEAQVTIEKCIAAAPEDSYAYSVLGVIQYKQGQFDKAINALTKSLSFNPKNAEAHNYLGITCSQKGWQTAAEQELRKAIDLNPNYAEAHFNLAVVYATQTPPAPDLAREHYKKAQDLGMSPDPELEKLLGPKPSS